MKRTHYLKTWPEFFEAIKFGKKTFEIRINDRGYQVDDTLILQEFDPETGYTDSDDISLDVAYTLDNSRLYLWDIFVWR